jgi:hypothetical protein
MVNAVATSSRRSHDHALPASAGGVIEASVNRSLLYQSRLISLAAGVPATFLSPYQKKFCGFRPDSWAYFSM